MKTKSAEIAEILQKELEQGIYAVGNRFPAEGELAERFHVGTATANRAVSKLEDLGYLVRKGSRRDGMRVATTKIFPLGLLCCYMDLNSDFHCRILSGVLRGAMMHRYAVVPFPYMNNNQNAYEKILATERFAGVVSLMKPELKIQLPVVYADNTSLDHISGLYHVRGDLRSGCSKMIHYLQKRKGCREIVYCHSCQDILETVPRRQGFLETLKETGCNDPERRIFTASACTVHEITQTLREILKTYPKVDAIICENDRDAFCAKCGLTKLLRSNHREIIVTGFGNLKACQTCIPFPTVEQHPEQTGFRAIAKLIQLIQHPERTLEKIEELPVELILHETYDH